MQFTKLLARCSPSYNDLRDPFLQAAPFTAYGSFRNCTRQNHGTAGNREAGGFGNGAVSTHLDIEAVIKIYKQVGSDQNRRTQHAQ